MRIKLIVFVFLCFCVFVVKSQSLNTKSSRSQNISGLIQGANVLIEDPLGHKIGRLGNNPVVKEVTSGNDLYLYHAESANSWELGINRALPGLYKVTFEGTGDSSTFAHVTPEDYYNNIYKTEPAIYDSRVFGVLPKGEKKTYEIFIPSYPGIIGDVNKDGDITEEDLVEFKQTGINYYTSNLFTDSKDLNKDGEINQSDYTLLEVLISNYRKSI